MQAEYGYKMEYNHSDIVPNQKQSSETEQGHLWGMGNTFYISQRHTGGKDKMSNTLLAHSRSLNGRSLQSQFVISVQATAAVRQA